MSIIDDSVVELERRKEALKMFEMKRMDCERERERDRGNRYNNNWPKPTTNL